MFSPAVFWHVVAQKQWCLFGRREDATNNGNVLRVLSDGVSIVIAISFITDTCF